MIFTSLGEPRNLKEDELHAGAERMSRGLKVTRVDL
jgi:hypothetical protein